MIKDLERKMEGLVGLDPQEQLLAILQSLSKEEIEKIPDGAGTVTSLNTGEQHRKRGLFVAYRRRCNLGSTDRIWRFFPLNGNPINNITEIVSQIRFDRSKNYNLNIRTHTDRMSEQDFNFDNSTTIAGSFLKHYDEDRADELGYDNDLYQSDNASGVGDVNSSGNVMPAFAGHSHGGPDGRPLWWR